MTGYLFYRYHKSTQESGSQSWISGLLERFAPEQKVFEERNAIRTMAMEKAASDRHLFHSQGPPEHVDLLQPEYVPLFFLFSLPARNQTYWYRGL